MKTFIRTSVSRNKQNISHKCNNNNNIKNNNSNKHASCYEMMLLNKTCCNKLKHSKWFH